MTAFGGWHLLVLALIVAVPVLVVAAVATVAVLLGRRSRAASEERIAQRTAALLRDRPHP